jgi:Ca-activated chloride channel family protein
MDFLYPQFLWLLVIIPLPVLLWGLGLWHHWRMRGRFGDLTNLGEISRVSWSGHGWLRGAMFAASLVATALGLAYPQVLTRDVRAVPKATDVVFMLDVSPSMFAADMDPHRLGRAQQIIQQFILNKLPDDRYALVTFNFNAIILSYLTRDPQNTLVYFDYLNRTTDPGVGTNMGAALVSALRVVEADEKITPENRERRRVLVLISDGDDNLQQWELPVSDVVARQLKVYTFGLGTSSGAPFPLRRSGRGDVIEYAITQTGDRVMSKAQARTLLEIARRTGGRFFRGEDNRQVQTAVDEILSSGRPVGGYQAYPIRQDLYIHFLSAAFIFMLAGAFL